jgi:hypothetical protein
MVTSVPATVTMNCDDDDDDDDHNLYDFGLAAFETNTRFRY